MITDGSVQADEAMYWFAAQTLAKEGYVVLTFDPQGQGQSDTFGAGADRQEGVPAQSDGRPFYDGTEDALNFFLSTRREPVPAGAELLDRDEPCGQAEPPRQGRTRRGVQPVLEDAQPHEIGLAGHSYGAAGVSYIGQWDHRVKAIVAWDNLGGPGPTSGPYPGRRDAASASRAARPNPAARRTVPMHTPALGISADYGLPPTPNASKPDPQAKSLWSLRVQQGRRRHRRDHHPRRLAPGLLATSRTRPSAPRCAGRTSATGTRAPGSTSTSSTSARPTGGCSASRWRHDEIEAGVDPSHDGNAFSFYYPSRLDVHRYGGRHVLCRNLRAGCAALVRHDGVRGAYRFVRIDQSPDR